MISLPEALSALVGLAALTVSIVALVRTTERRVRWRVDFEPDSRSWYRLVNESTKWTARVTVLEDADADRSKEGGMIMVTPNDLPIDIEPGNSYRFIAHQLINAPHLRARVVWQQRPFTGGRLRRHKWTTYLYL